MRDCCGVLRARSDCLLESCARARARIPRGKDQTTKLQRSEGANQRSDACLHREEGKGGREGGRRGCFGCSFVRLHCIGSEQGKPVLRRGKERVAPVQLCLV